MKKIKVYTANELQQDSKDALQPFYVNKYSDENVEFEYIVDKTLIGGIKVVDGFSVFDGTIAAELSKIKKKLQ